MSAVYRSNRKATDEDIIRMNSIGLSLGTIARTLEVHPTTVTLRLKGLGIPPADTRHTFMEGIVASLSAAQQEWLVNQVSAELPIRDFVRTLLISAYERKV